MFATGAGDVQVPGRISVVGRGVLGVNGKTDVGTVGGKGTYGYAHAGGRIGRVPIDIGKGTEGNTVDPGLGIVVTGDAKLGGGGSTGSLGPEGLSWAKSSHQQTEGKPKGSSIFF